jgi:hypothetical protein
LTKYLPPVKNICLHDNRLLSTKLIATFMRSIRIASHTFLIAQPHRPKI